MADRFVRGISEIYVDLLLTLIVLSVSGTLIAGVSTLARKVDYSEMEVPLTYTLLVNSSGCWLLIICNYGDDAINYTVLIGNAVVHYGVLSPRNFTVVALSPSSKDQESVEVLVDGEFMMEPQVIVT